MSQNCLYIGRFQPFHVGHLDVINQIFAYGYASITVGIGSINKQDIENPFSFSQRKEMILGSLADRGIDHKCIEIVGIPDVSKDEDWYEYIIDTIPFAVVMSGNQRVIDIFQHHDHEVLKEEERIHIHGTDIRNLLDRGDTEAVEQWVTPSVYKIIKKHKN